jgi:hypothetical protein
VELIDETGLGRLDAMAFFQFKNLVWIALVVGGVLFTSLLMKL